MADIDSLQIEIAAESTSAVEKINSLTQALKELKATLSGDFSTKSFQGVGQNVSGTKVRQSYNNARTHAQTSGSMKDLTAEMRAINQFQTQLDKMRSRLAKTNKEFDKAFDIKDEIAEQLRVSEAAGSASDDLKMKYYDACAAVEKLAQDIQKLNEQIDDFQSRADSAAKSGGFPEIDASAKENIKTAQKTLDDFKQQAQQSINAPQAVSSNWIGDFQSATQMLSRSGIGKNVSDIANLAFQFDAVSSSASAAGASAAGAGSAIASIAGPIGIAVSILDILKQKFEENKEFLQSDRSIWTDFSGENIANGFQNIAAALMVVNPLIKPAVYGLRSFIQPGQELLSVLSSLAENGFKKAGEALKQFASSGFQKAGDAVKSFASNVSKGVGSVATNLGKRFISPFQKAIDTVTKWQKSLGRLVFYRAINAAIRAVTDGIQEGIKNLYQYSQAVGTKFAPAMDSLSSSSMYLKNSLAAMAAPLIQAVAPAIDFIISKLVTLLNLIGAVFAALTGQGFFTKATKGATQFGDAVGGAAGSAKKLKDYMLGIDELNVINDDSGGGGGGGGGGGLDYSDMFEETELPDWAQKIKDAVQAGDWYGAGSLLAEKLNSLLSEWDSEAWGKSIGIKIEYGIEFGLGFLEKFNFDTAGEKLAGAINGIGKGINFTTLGNLIGAGWNAVFSTANGFFKKINWNAWGNHIADAINGWNDEVDWGLIAETFNNGILGLLTTITTAITKTDWASIASNIATAINNLKWYDIAYAFTTLLENALKEAATTASTFAEKLEWKSIAKSIAGGINDALRKMGADDWKAIGKSISDLIGNAIGGIGEFLDTLGWDQIGRAIESILEGMDWEKLLGNAGHAISSGFNGVITVVYDIVKDPKFWKKLGTGVEAGVKEFFGNFKIGDAIDALGTALGEGIKLAITAVNALTETSEFWDGLQTGIDTGLTSFFSTVEPEELVNAATGFLQKIIETAISTVSSLASNSEWFAELGTAIGTGINDLVTTTDWKTTLTSLATLATNIITGIANALKGIDWEKVRSALKQAFDEIEWEPLIDAALDLLAEAFKATAQLKLTKIDIFTKVGSELGKGLGRAIDKGLSSIPFFGAIWRFWGEALPFLQKIGELAVAIFSGNWGAIPGIVGEAMELASGHSKQASTDIVNQVSASMSTMRDTVSKVGLETAGKLKGSQESMRTTTDEKWEAIRSLQAGILAGMETDVNTEMPLIQKAVTDANAGMESSTSEKWGLMSQTTKNTTTNIKTGVSEGFTKIKNSIKTAMSDSSKSTTEKMGEIKKTVNTKSEESLKAVKDNFGKVDSTVKTNLNAAKTNALNQDWSPVGENLISGVSSGVRKKAQELINSVTSSISAALNAAKSAAGIHSPSTVWRDQLGIMLGLGAAEGVEDSTPKVMSSVRSLVDGMKSAFTDISETSIPLSFPVHKEMTANYSAKVAAPEMEDTAHVMADSMKSANEESTSLLLNALQRVVDAINEISDRPIEVSLDGRKNMQSVEKAQRQRGFNVLAGGVSG